MIRFPSWLKDAVYPVVLCNGYFTHTEHFLLAITKGEREKVLGHWDSEGFLKQERWSLSVIKVRQFKEPMINFSATYYYEMSDRTTNRLEAPLPKSLFWNSIHEFHRVWCSTKYSQFPLLNLSNWAGSAIHNRSISSWFLWWRSKWFHYVSNEVSCTHSKLQFQTSVQNNLKNNSLPKVGWLSGHRKNSRENHILVVSSPWFE